MREDVFTSTRRLRNMELRTNISQTAEKLNCNWRTAKKYLEVDTLQQVTKQRKKKPTKLDGYHEIIKDKYLNCNATGYSIYQFIKSKGYNGSYDTVKSFIVTIKNEKTKQASIRFETPPGEQAQVDWKEKLKLISKHGELFEINIFCIVLGYSRSRFYVLTENRNQSTLLKCLVNAFKYYGGVPKTIVFDNMKTVVMKARTNTEDAKINSKFEQFSKDIGFKIKACRGYRPKTKGKTEATVRITNKLNVYNHEFEDWDELNNILIGIMNDINSSVSQAHNKIPNELLKVEKEYLISLPNDEILNTYSDTPIIRKVSKESLVQYMNNKYSVPTQYIDKEVQLKIYTSTLEIYYSTELIRSHELSNEHSKNIIYNQEDMINILKSDAFKYKTETELIQISSDMLSIYDSLIGG